MRAQRERIRLRLVGAALVVASVFTACGQHAPARGTTGAEPEVTGSITVNLATEVTGTLAPSSLGTQSANTVPAGPTSGSAAAPTWRYLTAADMPATVVTATVSSAGSLYYSTAGGAASTALADVATGQVLVSGGVGAAPSYSANPAVNSVVAATTVADSSGDGLKNDIGTGYVGLTTGGTVRLRCAGAICGVPDEGASTTSFSFSGTTGGATSQVANMTTGTTVGYAAVCPTASTNATRVQCSPTVRLGGHTWDTDDGTDRQTDFYLQTCGTAADSVTAQLSLMSQVAPGSVTTAMQVSSTGSVTAGPSSANAIKVSPAASGSTSSITMSGATDTNAGLNLVPKGTGTLQNNGQVVPSVHGATVQQAIEYGTVASCGTTAQTITFGTAFSSNPVCVCSNASSAANGCRATPGGSGANVVIQSVNALDSDTCSYVCIGNR